MLGEDNKIIQTPGTPSFLAAGGKLSQQLIKSGGWLVKTCQSFCQKYGDCLVPRFWFQTI